MPFGRRRRRDAKDDKDDNVDLSSPEHAWWAAPDDPSADDDESSSGPYAVLGLDDSATWEEITAAHRKMVKALHPDQMVDAADEERARFEGAMRDINAAFSELKTRKGK